MELSSGSFLISSTAAETDFLLNLNKDLNGTELSKLPDQDALWMIADQGFYQNAGNSRKSYEIIKILRNSLKILKRLITLANLNRIS